MRLIFNHDEDALPQHNHSQKILQASHVMKGPSSPVAAAAATLQASQGTGVQGVKSSRKKPAPVTAKDISNEEEGS